MQPTHDLYDFFTQSYDHFNESLFGGDLAPCMLTVQRQKGCMGLFYSERWVAENGAKCHELALNPTYFGACRVVEMFQTLVHEQCHVWQQEYGKPSRAGYHNREWADKMESAGLMPSTTGAPGGKRTGQHMSDYALVGGHFLAAARNFIERGEKLRWTDRFRVADTNRPAPPLRHPDGEHSCDHLLLAPVTTLFADVENDDLTILKAQHRKNKIKYTCPGCACSVWGKPRLRIRCEACNLRLEAP